MCLSMKGSPSFNFEIGIKIGFKVWGDKLPYIPNLGRLCVYELYIYNCVSKTTMENRIILNIDLSKYFINISIQLHHIQFLHFLLYKLLCIKNSWQHILFFSSLRFIKFGSIETGNIIFFLFSNRKFSK